MKTTLSLIEIAITGSLFAQTKQVLKKRTARESEFEVPVKFSLITVRY